MVTIPRRAAGQDDSPISELTELRSSVEDRSRTAAKAAGKGATVEQIRRIDPDLVEHEERPLGAALLRVVESLPEGGRALVVRHSPTNEAAVAGLRGETVEPLGKGAGVLLIEDDSKFTIRPL
jgi:hypothetical protein